MKRKKNVISGLISRMKNILKVRISIKFIVKRLIALKIGEISGVIYKSVGSAIIHWIINRDTSSKSFPILQNQG